MLAEIAVGGMAEIHVAKQRLRDGLEKLVVIKTVRSHLKNNREFTQMFLNEARIASRLEHPNIVQMYDLGYADGSYFLAMEYVHGENLRSVARACRKRRRLIPLAHTTTIGALICQGLHHAHTKKDVLGRPLDIVHCDISPQNIMLSFAGEVKVGDFGVARAASRFEDQQEGIVKGKLSYMSPEQVSGKQLDARTDIFSLGVILWEAASGKRLFNHPSMGRVVRAICEDRPEPPSHHNRKIPSDLDAVVLKAIEKNPDDRFQSARQMYKALDQVNREHGLVSNTDDLAAFMQHLFEEKAACAERIQKAQKAGVLETVLFRELNLEPIDAGPDADEKPQPVQPPPAPTATAPEQAHAASSDLPVVRGQLFPPARPPRLPRWALVAILVCALAVIGLGIGLLIPPDRSGEQPAQVSPPAARFGIVRVISEPPEAIVSVDGIERCFTPCIIQKLEIGREVGMRVTRDGYEPWETTFRLDKEFEVRKFDVTMRNTTQRGWGQVRVITKPPGATVTFNDRPLKRTTPLTLPRVVADRQHVLRAKLEGHKTWTTTFTVKPGQKITLHGDLPAAAPAGEPPTPDPPAPAPDEP